MRLRTSLITLLLVMLGACGGRSPPASSSDTIITSPSTTEASALPGTTAPSNATTTPVETPTTTTPVESSTTTSPTSATALPGEPIDFGPSQGDILAVVGVTHDDVLNLRSGPGVGQTIVGTIDPRFDDLVAQGHTREIPGAFWIEVGHQGMVGWVNFRYVAYLGDTVDMTATTVEEHGLVPTGATMEELGLTVARLFASQDPESELVLSLTPTTGHLDEVTIDVIGLGDDAQYGIRLHVLGSDSDGTFSLESVEATYLCGRGVSAGLCV